MEVPVHMKEEGSNKEQGVLYRRSLPPSIAFCVVPAQL